ncbi:MAG: phage/plasmid replication domain-containing protein [Gammaproteobacteria bacterium]
MVPSTLSRSRMFYDYLTVEQVFPHALPSISDTGICYYDRRTGETLRDTAPGWKHEGSYSTLIKIRVDGCKLRVEGNPSAVNRLDNLHGFQTLDECFAVYNRILREYPINEYGFARLPTFTKGTHMAQRQVQGAKGKWDEQLVGDGARIRRVDLTTNRTVGKGNDRPYIRALSTQRFGYKNGHLFEDGWTVDWTARDHYEKAYGKAFAIRKFLFPKCKKNFGEDSPEFRYLQALANYCDEQGVVRMEQELKSEYLTREGLDWWGLFDESRFSEIHKRFLAIDDKLEATAMDYRTIADQLIAKGIVTSRQAANATANVAMEWMHCPGVQFDFKKSQMKTYRARLNRIGINIAMPHDITRHTAVLVRRVEEIVTCDDLVLPSWYRHPVAPRRLQLVAA